MSSKSLKKIRLIVLNTCLVATIGCGLKTGEKNKTENVAKLSSTSCLDQSLSGLKLFLKGDAKNEQVAESVTCFQTVLTSFKENIRGKEKGSYTPEEVGEFIKQNFAKGSDSKIGPELLSEIMKIKVVLLGGDTKLILKTEVDALAKLIADYKPQLIKLNPHMKVITTNWSPENISGENVSKYKEAKIAFTSVVNQLGYDLAKSGKKYEINDLVNLAYQLVKTFSSNSDTLNLIDKARGLVSGLKMALIGGEASLSGNEWVAFSDAASELYFQKLRLDYFHKNLSEDQISEKWNVYGDIVVDVSDLMQKMLSQKESGVLTNAEIAELLKQASEIAPDLKIDSELVDQVGKLKLIFVGDTKSDYRSWSRNDFVVLQAKSPSLFSQISNLIANGKYLKPHKAEDGLSPLKLSDFTKAEGTVVGAVRLLSNLIIGSYDLVDLKSLLVQLSKGLLKDRLTLPENFEELFELAVSAKYTLTGEEGTKLNSKQLHLLINVGIRAYFHYVEYSHFAAPFKIHQKEFNESLANLASKVADTLKLELELKPSHMISSKEFTQLILTAQKTGQLKTKLTEVALTNLFSQLWERILNTPDNRLKNKRASQGFDLAVLSNLVNEVSIWLQGQKAILTVYSGKESFGKAELLNLFKELNFESSELYRALIAPGELNFNDKPYLRILTTENGNYRIQDLIKSNISRAITRLVIRGYADEVQRANSLNGVTLAEAEYGFSKLKQLGVDLGAIAENNDTFIASRFRESNLFLAPSNGDEYSSFEEMHHLIIHIMSGQQRSESLKILADQKCIKTENAVAIPNTLYNEECLLDLYLAEKDSFLDLPDFIKIKDNFSAEQNKTYYLSLLKAAGHVQNEQKTVLLTDAALFAHAVQYVESIYARHDVNKDMLIEKKEALVAFAVFDKLITDLAKAFPALVKADMPGVFIYLLKYGKAPKTLADKLKFAAFVKDHDCSDNKPCQKDWDIQTTRHDIGKIFNFIADATKPPAPPASGAIQAKP